MIPCFKNARRRDMPFPYAKIPEILERRAADCALDWLRTEAPWMLRVEDFYQQHEFSLLSTPLSPELGGLTAPTTIVHVRESLAKLFALERPLALVDVTAHCLTAGQVIRIHNDYISEAETHRLLIQLNGGWRADMGGLLMLFARDVVESVTDVLMPSHGSGFAFEISPSSFHAVSEIKSGERYTLVYTFA
jgi:hypothetical protein